MAIVYAEPRYSFKNIALSGLGDVIGKVAENWINRGKMSKLKAAEADYFQAMKEYAQNLPRVGAPEGQTEMVQTAPAAPKPFMASGDRAADKGGFMTAPVFEKVAAKPGSNPYTFMPVDAVGMMNAGLQALKKSGRLAYAPNFDLQQAMFLSQAMDASRLAEFYGGKSARVYGAQDELYGNMKGSKNPYMVVLAPAAYLDDSPGKTGVEGAVGYGKNTNEARYNEIYGQAKDNEYTLGLERNAIEREHIKAMREENNIRRQQTLMGNPNDDLTKQKLRYFDRIDSLLTAGPSTWTEADWLFMYQNDEGFRKPIANQFSPTGFVTPTMADYKASFGIGNGSQALPGKGATDYSGTGRSAEWVRMMGQERL